MSYVNSHLLEQKSVRAATARVSVLYVVLHPAVEVKDCAVPAHSEVRDAAGTPAPPATEGGDGFGLLAALALALLWSTVDYVEKSEGPSDL